MVNELKRKRNLALALYFGINYLLIGFLSTIQYDPDKLSLFDYSLRFDPKFTLLIILISVVLQFGFAYVALILMMKQNTIEEIYPGESKDTELELIIREEFDIDRLVKSTLKLAKKSNIELTKIYLTNDPIPNAASIMLPGQKSAIFINTNILEIMNAYEVNAVIGHELGHIKNKDSVLKLISRAPEVFVNISFTYLYILILLTIFNDLFFHFNLTLILFHIFLLFFVNYLAQVLSITLRTIVAYANQQAELLADIHGSKITSPIFMMNALIRLGQRTEAVSTLMEVLASMEGMKRKVLAKHDSERLLHMIRSFPLDEIDEFKAAISGPLIYISSELKYMRDIFLIPLSDDEIIQLSQQAVENMHKNDILPTKNLKVLNRLKVVSKNWREFDYNQDQTLDKKELDDFVDALQNDPEKFIFTSEISSLSFLNDHPNIRDRILNLYKWST